MAAKAKKRSRLGAVETVPIDSLTPYPGNARRGNVKAIRESLRAHGQFRPLVVWAGKDQILAGNHTWRAAKEEGWELVEVVRVKATEREARKIVLADNRTSDQATYDPEKLTELLDSLDGDLFGSGFDEPAVNRLLTGDKSPLSSLTRMTHGIGYNTEAKPHDLNAYKLGLRMEAVLRCERRGAALDAFAGAGQLTYWYRRVFDRVVTVDQAEGFDVDFQMPAEDYIRERLLEDGPFDFVDLDDEGCPWRELDALFEVLAGSDWPPLVLTLTDGMATGARIGAGINPRAHYRWDANMNRSSPDYFQALPDLLAHGVRTRAGDAGWEALDSVIEWKPGKRAVYGAWLLRPRS